MNHLLVYILYRHDIVNIDLKNKPDWFFEKNPLGLVPVLETQSGQVIQESPITCEYLDEAYPQKKLFPSDPFQKAQQKMLLEDFSKVGRYYQIEYRNVIYISRKDVDKMSDC